MQQERQQGRKIVLLLYVLLPGKQMGRRTGGTESLKNEEENVTP